MNDPNLAERIDMLVRDLEWADKGQIWLEGKLGQGRLAADLWGALRTIRGQITGQTQALKDIREEVQNAAKESPESESQALKKAWQRYAEIYQESRQIFGEYLDFIGGVVIRYEELDSRICYIADELIKRCSNESIGITWQSLTVVALQESFAKTLARIIRLRFPEWTIWALPFAAHEYGHVLIEEVERIKQFIDAEAVRLEAEKLERGAAKEIIAEVNTIKTFIDAEVIRLAKENAEPNVAKEIIAEVNDIKAFIDAELTRLKAVPDKAGNLTDESVKSPAGKQIRKHIKVLFADAFATYMMGPAYACAAIHLRFDPANAGTLEADLPSDAKRAFVVLEVLKRMNRAVPGDNYKWVIERLDETWKKMLERAGSSVTPDETEMKKQVGGIWRTLTGTLLSDAGYPVTSETGGWLKAQEWAATWLQQLGREPLTSAPVMGTNKLRDSLNAAWFCRMRTDDPQALRYLADAAQNLCEEIIQKQHIGKGRKNPPRRGQRFRR